MSPKHHAEIDDELIGYLRKLSSEQLKAALEELRKSKKFVIGTKGNQLAVPTIIQTEDMSTQFTLTALVDRCTGSCGSVFQDPHQEAQGSHSGVQCRRDLEPAGKDHRLCRGQDDNHGPLRKDGTCGHQAWEP